MTGRLTSISLLTRSLVLAGALVAIAACVNTPRQAIVPETAHPLFVDIKDEQIFVRLPDCGDFSMRYNFRNLVSRNWGCAHQRNRGLMMANPADLVGAVAFERRDPARTAKVIRDYRRGKATLSDYGSLSGAPVDRGGF